MIKVSAFANKKQGHAFNALNEEARAQAIMGTAYIILGLNANSRARAVKPFAHLIKNATSGARRKTGLLRFPTRNRGSFSPGYLRENSRYSAPASSGFRLCSGREQLTEMAADVYAYGAQIRVAPFYWRIY
ncbi:MAG: hypothetical protein HY885_02535 [Deltaproteobacteria bacterium]|nr:hypothetical protein [Deltaproteobacteria bacterium]